MSVNSSVNANSQWVVSTSYSNGIPASAGNIGPTGSPKSPPYMPTGFTYPFGLYDFTLTNGAGPAYVTLTLPTPAPSNAVFMKYGRQPGATSPSWYVLPSAVFAPDRLSVSLTLNDGQLGDDDGLANGFITDPSTIGVPTQDSLGGIPMLSTLGDILLCMVLAAGALVGLGIRRRKSSIENHRVT